MSSVRSGFPRAANGPNGPASRARLVLRLMRVWKLRDLALALWYRWRRTRPLDPNLAVFGSYFYRGVSDSPQAIYELARRAVPGFRGVWVVERSRVADTPAGVPHVVARTFAYYDVLARAKVFVNNVNFPNDVIKRPGTVHVMTHHGTPLKHMGLDVAGKSIPDGRLDRDALLGRSGRWDYSLSSNRHSSRVWERVFPGQYESLEIGYPRNDVLVNAEPADVLSARHSLGISSEQKVLLYAPTHRDTDSGYVARLDVRALSDALGDGWTVLCRRHYFYDREEQARVGESVRVIDVAQHPSISDLCLAADVLCTDYSSIMFDYAILDRPIVIFAPDWQEYVDTRGVYFDLINEGPGVVTRTQAELLEALWSGRYEAADAREARARFRERYIEFEHGTASQRVVQRLWPQARFD